MQAGHHVQRMLAIPVLGLSPLWGVAGTNTSCFSEVLCEKYCMPVLTHGLGPEHHSQIKISSFSYTLLLSSTEK